MNLVKRHAWGLRSAQMYVAVKKNVKSQGDLKKLYHSAILEEYWML
jgi:hypothetical protein